MGGTRKGGNKMKLVIDYHSTRRNFINVSEVDIQEDGDIIAYHMQVEEQGQGWRSVYKKFVKQATLDGEVIYEADQ